MSGFSHSLTTSTFSPSRREWVLSMLSCRRNCSGMPTFGSMAGKHTSGMPPVLSHPFVKPSNALLRRLIRRHECGVVQTSPHTVKVFVFWVLLWDILISFEHSWRRPRLSIKCCWTESLRLPDLQSAWSLLVHCAASRANYFLRVVPPELGEELAHDRSLWACLCNMMGISEDGCEATAREAALLPLALSELDLRSARRTHRSAYWASWADSLHMV